MSTVENIELQEQVTRASVPHRPPQTNIDDIIKRVKLIGITIISIIIVVLVIAQSLRSDSSSSVQKIDNIIQTLNKLSSLSNAVHLSPLLHDGSYTQNQSIAHTI